MQNIFAGSINSVATSLEWGLAELIHRPHMLQKVHEELDRVVGRGRVVEEADMPNLPYLQAVVKETFRLHPAVPLTLPHMNPKASCVQGYDIPANSNVTINIYAIGRDPASWETPNEFKPDRFLRFDKDAATPTVKSTGFELLPFGYGRRGCVGMNLGNVTVQFGLASLVQAFDWSPAPGVDPKSMNMEETFRSEGPIAEELVAVATPRLQSSLY